MAASITLANLVDIKKISIVLYVKNAYQLLNKSKLVGDNLYIEYTECFHPGFLSSGHNNNT